MKLVTGIRVKGFRSLRDTSVEKLGQFSAFAGANNAGKSNVLRALCAFFTDQIEPGVALDVRAHCWRPLLKQKKKKVIFIALEFSLPAHFKFRKGLESVGEALGTNFILVKCWSADGDRPIFYLHKSAKLDEVDFDHLDSKDVFAEESARSFLGLIGFRYIPNRVIPTEVIRSEHQALRDVLVRRLAKFKSSEAALFQKIESTAKNLLSSVSQQISTMVPNVDALTLGTARSLADLAFKFGYLVAEGGSEMTEDEQGSGMQSLLMLQTLHMIDLDYFQQFGWKQASIWAVEEPESSLHAALEARVAHYLSTISRDSQGRLQTMATTHSDLVIQYADQGFLVTKQSKEASSEKFSVISAVPPAVLVSKAAGAGISRWVNPILLHPLSPVVLVEGKFDRDVLRESSTSNPILRRIVYLCLEDLTGNADKGGVSSLKEFVKANAAAIQTRFFEAPVIVVLDWDASGKKAEFQKLVDEKAPYAVLVWNVEGANPRLTQSFRGIERFLPDRIIDAVWTELPEAIAKTPDGKLVAIGDDYSKVKRLANAEVQKGLEGNDILHLQRMHSDLMLSVLVSPGEPQ